MNALNRISHHIESATSGYCSFEKLAVIAHLALFTIAILGMCGVTSHTVVCGTTLGFGVVQLIIQSPDIAHHLTNQTTANDTTAKTANFVYTIIGAGFGEVFLVLGSIGLAGHLTTMSMGWGIIGTQAIGTSFLTFSMCLAFTAPKAEKAPAKPY